MAATGTILESFDIGGNYKQYFGTIVPDDSWLAAGEVVDFSGNERIDHLVVTGGGAGYVFQWDAAGQKLLAYYADYDAVADGALVAVPDATDLDALTLTFVAWGQ